VKQKFGGVSVIHLRFADYGSDAERKLLSLPGVQRIVHPEEGDEPLKVFVEDANAVLPEIIEVATVLKLRITELRVEEPSLDDVFVQMMNSKGEHKDEQFS